MIFQYKYEFDVKKIQKLVKFKKLKILDFGCGIGNWSASNVNSNAIKQITLYDNDKNLKKTKNPNRLKVTKTEFSPSLNLQ